MPGLPLTVREATNNGCSCSQSRTADQMCRQQSRVRLTAEEQIAAEESLNVYCKPVELYNILQRRNIRNPLFLQRCLQYKIQAKRKRRIQITVSLIGSLNPELRQQNLFPLYVLLARPVADTEVSGENPVYRFSRPGILSNIIEFAGKDHTEARFVIPEIKKLVNDARFNNLTIIIISKGTPNVGSDDNHPRMESEATTSFPNLEGNCLWGKVPVDSLCLSFEKCVTLSLEHRADMLSPVNMQPSFLEPRFSGKNNCIFFRSPGSAVTSTCQIQVSICAQELGANEASPYDSYSYNDVPASLLPHIIRLRAGNVVFNYKYYNNLLQKTEVTEDFSCPFCLVKCASFKGLRYHLISSHDLFNYEFWVTEDYQAVNVSARTDNWHSELVSDGTDPRLQTFLFCSRIKKWGRSKHLVQVASNVQPHVPESGSPVAALESSHEEYNKKENGTFNSHMPLAYTANVSHNNENFSKEKTHNSLFGENHLLMARNKSESFGSQNRHAAECIDPLSSSPDTSGFCAATAQTSTSNDFVQQASASNVAHQNVLPLAKMRKNADERADPRNKALLTRRQFYHSHRAQPMAMEQVFSDQDSEDEIDDDIADLEDRRMLDDFVDVTKDEKQIMHLWNSFVRKQRVLADGHIPWACEAFTRLHGQELVLAPPLLWCWRLFMIKLWTHSLLDARTFNNCSLILDQFKSGGSNPDAS